MIIKAYRNYLFDADGTLIDTAELVYRTFQYACETFGGFSIERSRVLSDMGMPLSRQIQLYLGKQPADRLAAILSDYKDYQLSIYRDHLKVFPGVIETLKALKQRDRRLVVVTSRKMETAGLYLKVLDLFDFFEHIITPEATTKHKPNPEPAIKALELINGIPSESLFVGDAGFDILCGQRAGTDTAFVSWSPNKADDIEPPPTYILREMTDLIDQP